MGFFSWECKGCGKSMLSSWAEGPDWMRDVVVIEPGGTILKGQYDGYGRVNGRDINTSDIDWEKETGHPECYHEDCWELSGRPTKYTGGSEHSADQGFFFDPEEYEDVTPKSR